MPSHVGLPSRGHLQGRSELNLRLMAEHQAGRLPCREGLHLGQMVSSSSSLIKSLGFGSGSMPCFIHLKDWRARCPMHCLTRINTGINGLSAIVRVV